MTDQAMVRLTSAQHKQESAIRGKFAGLTLLYCLPKGPNINISEDLDCRRISGERIREIASTPYEVDRLKEMYETERDSRVTMSKSLSWSLL